MSRDRDTTGTLRAAYQQRSPVSSRLYCCLCFYHTAVRPGQPHGTNVNIRALEERGSLCASIRLGVVSIRFICGGLGTSYLPRLFHMSLTTDTDTHTLLTHDPKQKEIAHITLT